MARGWERLGGERLGWERPLGLILMSFDIQQLSVLFVLHSIQWALRGHNTIVTGSHERTPQPSSKWWRIMLGLLWRWMLSQSWCWGRWYSKRCTVLFDWPHKSHHGQLCHIYKNVWCLVMLIFIFLNGGFSNQNFPPATTLSNAPLVRYMPSQNKK